MLGERVPAVNAETIDGSCGEVETCPICGKEVKLMANIIKVNNRFIRDEFYWCSHCRHEVVPFRL